MKKYLRALLVSVLVLSTLAGCGKQSDKEPNDNELIVLREAVMTGHFSQYVTIIGLEKGIFEKYGIDLQVTEFAYGINTLDAVSVGLADFGFTASFATVNRFGNSKEGTDLVIFSNIYGKYAAQGGLYVAPQYYDNPDALDGSEGFIITIGTQSEYDTGRVIEYIGLDENNQNFLNTTGTDVTLALVQEGRASGIVTSGATARRISEDYGWKEYVSAKDVGLSSSNQYITTREFASENAELLANFLLASEEIYAYINSNLDECSELVANRLGAEAADVKSAMTCYVLSVDLPEDEIELLEDIGTWAVAHGKYEENFNIRDYITLDVLELKEELKSK